MFVIKYFMLLHKCLYNVELTELLNCLYWFIVVLANSQRNCTCFYVTEKIFCISSLISRNNILYLDDERNVYIFGYTYMNLYIFSFNFDRRGPFSFVLLFPRSQATATLQLCPNTLLRSYAQATCCIPLLFHPVSSEFVDVLVDCIS